MIKKTLDKLKQFFKENIKDIIILFVLYSIFMYPLDYYIITGGGIMKIEDRIVIENEYKSKGSFNLAYVAEIKGTVATYLLSYLMPNWEREKLSDYTYNDIETLKDVEFRSNIDLLQASDNAIKNAYIEAGKDYNISKKEVYVYYIDEKSKSNLKVGDQILSIDDQEIKDTDSMKNIISKYNVGDKLKIKVKRATKEKIIYADMYKEKDTKKLGIFVEEIHKYKTNPKIKIKFKKGETGPSGGLAETLDIYNKLTKKDITKGKVVVATGEIDKDGNILPIGGVKYKLLGAAKKKADIFIVPKELNYDECLKVAKKNNLKIKIIGVSTFKEAVEELDKLNK